MAGLASLPKEPQEAACKSWGAGSPDLLGGSTSSASTSYNFGANPQIFRGNGRIPKNMVAIPGRSGLCLGDHTSFDLPPYVELFRNIERCGHVVRGDASDDCHCARRHLGSTARKIKPRQNV